MLVGRLGVPVIPVGFGTSVFNVHRYLSYRYLSYRLVSAVANLWFALKGPILRTIGAPLCQGLHVPTGKVLAVKIVRVDDKDRESVEVRESTRAVLGDIQRGWCGVLLNYRAISPLKLPSLNTDLYFRLPKRRGASSSSTSCRTSCAYRRATS